MLPNKGSGRSYDGKYDVCAPGSMLVGGVLGKPLEDLGLNTVDMVVLNLAGDALIADGPRASPRFCDLGA